ncbi:MAG: hypothetical protein ACREDR_24370 [Blastocatellia bacterium]
MDWSDAARKLEAFLFHGVPERPEATFERDDHAHFTQRSTGRSLNSLGAAQESGEWVTFGLIRVDFENETETFERVEEDPVVTVPDSGNRSPE